MICAVLLWPHDFFALWYLINKLSHKCARPCLHWEVVACFVFPLYLDHNTINKLITLPAIYYNHQLKTSVQGREENSCVSHILWKSSTSKSSNRCQQVANLFFVLYMIRFIFLSLSSHSQNMNRNRISTSQLHYSSWYELRWDALKSSRNFIWHCFQSADLSLSKPRFMRWYFND